MGGMRWEQMGARQLRIAQSRLHHFHPFHFVVLFGALLSSIVLCSVDPCCLTAELMALQQQHSIAARAKSTTTSQHQHPRQSFKDRERHVLTLLCTVCSK